MPDIVAGAVLQAIRSANAKHFSRWVLDPVDPLTVALRHRVQSSIQGTASKADHPRDSQSMLAYSHPWNGGVVYTFHDTTYAYNPETNTWSSKSYSTSYANTSASPYIDNCIYVMKKNFTARYNVSSNSWTTMSYSYPPNGFGSGTSPSNGFIYCGTHYDTGTWYLDFHQYYPPTNTWTTKASTLYYHWGPSSYAIGTSVSYAGGMLPDYSYGAYHERYNPSTNSWTTLSSMPQGRRYHSGCVSYPFLRHITFCGEISSSTPYTSTILSYATETNTWSTMSHTISPARNGCGSPRLTYNNTAYVTCGKISDSIYTKTTIAYTMDGAWFFNALNAYLIAQTKGA